MKITIAGGKTDSSNSAISKVFLQQLNEYRFVYETTTPCGGTVSKIPPAIQTFP